MMVVVETMLGRRLLRRGIGNSRQMWTATWQGPTTARATIVIFNIFLPLATGTGHYPWHWVLGHGYWHWVLALGTGYWPRHWALKIHISGRLKAD